MFSWKAMFMIVIYIWALLMAMFHLITQSKPVAISISTTQVSNTTSQQQLRVILITLASTTQEPRVKNIRRILEEIPNVEMFYGYSAHNLTDVETVLRDNGFNCDCGELIKSAGKYGHWATTLGVWSYILKNYRNNEFVIVLEDDSVFKLNHYKTVQKLIETSYSKIHPSPILRLGHADSANLIHINDISKLQAVVISTKWPKGCLHQVDTMMNFNGYALENRNLIHAKTLHATSTLTTQPLVSCIDGHLKLS